MCVQDTYAEAWGEDRLEEVVQEAIQVPRGPGLTYGARGQSVSSAWGTGLPVPPISSILSTSACPLPDSPVWLLLGSGGAGPGGGPGGSEGAWTPGAGGISSALQETEAQLSRYLGCGGGGGGGHL